MRSLINPPTMQEGDNIDACSTKNAMILQLAKKYDNGCSLKRQTYALHPCQLTKDAGDAGRESLNEAVALC